MPHDRIPVQSPLLTDGPTYELPLTWLERVETYGGRRRELPRLLRCYCGGATRVVVYEARETIWDVRHVTGALERWQRAGGYV